MYQKLNEVLSGKENNFMLPFYWQHGDHYDTIPLEIERIYNSGCRAFCVESRPHKDFAGDSWWRDMDLILKEAKKRDMDVWILDDDHFPTGHAVGHIAKFHPEKRRWDIGERHVDVLGPVDDALLLTAERDTSPILGIYAYKRTGENENCSDNEIIDLSNKRNGKFVQVTLPEGLWRVFFIYKTRELKEKTDYIDMLSADSVKVLVDAVYEPHYEHYKEYFGNTIKGFFSDEPQFGNSWFSKHASDPGMYERRLGLPGMAYPWHEKVFLKMNESLGFDALSHIAALWFDIGECTSSVRYAYMDAVTRLYRESFTRQLGDWCSSHGVEYIGHVIEDMGSHQRTGCGTGHYFRALDGQHMSGIDIVLHQLMPGMSNYIHTSSTHGNNADPEFFDYTLCKLAPSLARISTEMKGRAMCEVFGAYGWAESGSDMKWLLDHLLVRGVNHFVPHAFSPLFPDPDCPPHFGANGKDPQYKAFSKLMTYGNKVSHLLSGAHHISDAAILYTAELEWMNEKDKVQPLGVCAKALYDNNIDFDFLPIDSIIGDKEARIYPVEAEGGKLKVGDNYYNALIIPEAPVIPEKLTKKLEYFERMGLNIIYMGLDATDKNLHQKLKAIFTPDIEVSGEREFLRSTHYTDGENDIYMFVNESLRVYCEAEVSLNNLRSEKGLCLELLNGSCTKVLAKDKKLCLSLAPNESQIFVFGDVDAELFGEKKQFTEYKEAKFSFKVEAADADDMENFTLISESTDNHSPINLNSIDNMPDFSGVIRYTASFKGGDMINKNLALDLIDLGNTAEVYLNGEYLGLRLTKPFIYDISGKIKEENTIVIEVSNTLANKVQDDFSQYMAINKAGLHFPVCFVFEKG